MTLAIQLNEAPTERPLVLLAPFPLDSRVWGGVLDRLDRRAITVDPPGFGGSEPVDEASLEAYAQAVLEALDAEGVDTFSVAGNSMGGYTALALAQLAPERVVGIGLVGTKGTADAEEARNNRLAMADRADGGASAAELVGPMVEKLLGESTRADNPVLVAQVEGWLSLAPTAGIAWAQRAMAARPDRLDALRSLDVPGVVLHGAQDPLMTDADAQALAEALGVDAVTLDCGHLLPLEDPDAVAEALRPLV